MLCVEDYKLHGDGSWRRKYDKEAIQRKKWAESKNENQRDVKENMMGKSIYSQLV